MDYAIQIVNTFEELSEDYEKIKGFWDSLGLCLYIAVKKSGIIAFSSKHWLDVIYLETTKTPVDLWLIIGKIANSVQRTMVKSSNGKYVYIPKLNESQTNEFLEEIKKELQNQNITFDEQIKFEWEWEVDDALLFDNKHI